jgi:hypothetical protein
MSSSDVSHHTRIVVRPKDRGCKPCCMGCGQAIGPVARLLHQGFCCAEHRREEIQRINCLAVERLREAACAFQHEETAQIPLQNEKVAAAAA